MYWLYDVIIYMCTQYDWLRLVGFLPTFFIIDQIAITVSRYKMTSDQPVVCSKTDDDVEHESIGNFLRFCRHMFSYRLNDEYLGCERFLSGGAYDVHVDEIAPGVRSDVDIMVVMPNCCAISADTHFVAPREISVFRIVTAGIHCGYARLVSEEHHVVLKHHWLFPEGLSETNVRRHGPAIYHNISNSQSEDWLSLKTTAVNIDPATVGNDMFDKSEVRKVKNVCSIDEVPCIRCPYWPSEAAEWITRRRLHAWPTKSLVDK